MGKNFWNNKWKKCRIVKGKEASKLKVRESKNISRRGVTYEKEEKKKKEAKTFTYWLNTNSWVKNTLRYDKIEVGKESNCSDVRVFPNKLENKRR